MVVLMPKYINKQGNAYAWKGLVVFFFLIEVENVYWLCFLSLTYGKLLCMSVL